MRERWKELGLSSLGEPDVDYERIKLLFDMNKLLAIVGRDEQGTLDSYFVGTIDNSMFQKSKVVLSQVSCGLRKRSMKDYLELISTVEKVARKFGIDVININLDSDRASELVCKKLGFVYNDTEIVKGL